MARLGFELSRRRAKTIQRLALITAILVYFLIVAGNIVRITDSGLGCPDWPLCYGNVIPIPDAKAIIEVAHRVFAAFVSIFIVVIAALNLRWRLSRMLVRLSAAMVVLLIAQIFLGALTVWSLLHAASVAAHLAAGMALLGCMVAMHIDARYLQGARAHIEQNRATRKLRRSLNALAAAVFVLLVTGGLVSGNGAAMACGQAFPLCNGGLLPNGGMLAFVQWLHRATAITVGLLAFTALIRLTRRGVQLSTPFKLAALALLVAFLLQGAIGATMVAFNRPAVLATLHNATAALVWMSALSLAMLANRLPVFVPDPPAKPAPRWRQTIDDYVALTKPRVISLLLFTTLAAMFITSAGAPPWYLVMWTMIGGYLMAGGANAVNMAYDADIDTVMGRTHRRPVPSGRISPRHALVFGVTLAVLSLLVFVLFVNLLAAALALLGFLYYTLIYTRWLKRSTWQNIVIGGGAGAIPPMIGWAAASGRLTWAAVILFVIVFYWTPPHFWALALLKRKDYAAAGVPMLPVVAGEAETARQILIYTFGMVAVTLVLVPLQAMGLVYLLGALALGGVFVWRAWQVNRERSPAMVLSLYKYSLLYLALLFAVMVLDRAIRN
jgi:protoheme IX farnesyltransferase